VRRSECQGGSTETGEAIKRENDSEGVTVEMISTQDKEKERADETGLYYESLRNRNEKEYIFKLSGPGKKFDNLS